MQSLKISTEHYRFMLLHVNNCLPEEACGILSGTSNVSKKVYPVTNQAHSKVRYYMDPFELLQTLEDIEAANQEILAIFHSHPQGPAYPSETDIAEFLYEGSATLIWAPDQTGWKCRAYMIERKKVREIRLIFDENS